MLVIEVRHCAVATIRKVGIVQVLDYICELLLRRAEATRRYGVFDSVVRIIVLV